MAVERALHQLTLGHGPGCPAGVLLGAGAPHVDADELGSTLGVAGHLVGQAGTDSGEGVGEGVGAGALETDRRVAGGARGEQEDRVVGAAGAVGGHLVEGGVDGPLQSDVQRP